MKKLVILPGGFHPWHAGHTALYQAAAAAFPTADVYVVATDDTSTRPFPFEVKKTLAKAAGVPANRFIKVSNPFVAKEVTQLYDPDNTVLIFVRSEKDQDNEPKPGKKKDGSPTWLQPYSRNGMLPMSKHAYIRYLPVVNFGPGMTSATELRSKWPDIEQGKKLQLAKAMYNTSDAAANVLVKILDSVLDPGTDEQVLETTSGPNTVDIPVVNGVAELASFLHNVVQELKVGNIASVQDLLGSDQLQQLLLQLGASDAGNTVTVADPDSVFFDSDIDSDYVPET